MKIKSFGIPTCHAFSGAVFARGQGYDTHTYQVIEVRWVGLVQTCRKPENLLFGMSRCYVCVGLFRFAALHLNFGNLCNDANLQIKKVPGLLKMQKGSIQSFCLGLKPFNCTRRTALFWVLYLSSHRFTYIMHT